MTGWPGIRCMGVEHERHHSYIDCVTAPTVARPEKPECSKADGRRQAVFFRPDAVALPFFWAGDCGGLRPGGSPWTLAFSALLSTRPGAASPLDRRAS